MISYELLDNIKEKILTSNTTHDNVYYECTHASAYQPSNVYLFNVSPYNSNNEHVYLAKPTLFIEYDDSETSISLATAELKIAGMTHDVICGEKIEILLELYGTQIKNTNDRNLISMVLPLPFDIFMGKSLYPLHQETQFVITFNSDQIKLTKLMFDRCTTKNMIMPDIYGLPVIHSQFQIENVKIRKYYDNNWLYISMRLKFVNEVILFYFYFTDQSGNIMDLDESILFCKLQFSNNKYDYNGNLIPNIAYDNKTLLSVSKNILNAKNVYCIPIAQFDKNNESIVETLQNVKSFVFNMSKMLNDTYFEIIFNDSKNKIKQNEQSSSITCNVFCLNKNTMIFRKYNENIKLCTLQWSH